MHDKELKKLAARIAARLFVEYESRSDDALAANDGEQKVLFTDLEQSERVVDPSAQSAAHPVA